MVVIIGLMNVWVSWVEGDSRLNPIKADLSLSIHEHHSLSIEVLISLLKHFMIRSPIF